MRPVIPPYSRLEDVDLDGWRLYKYPPDDANSFLWMRFKLMHPPRMPRKWGVKRTYTLAWNPMELRFAKSRESHSLSQFRPELCMKVELHMSLKYGPEYLTDPKGANRTPQEIAVERMRLRVLSAQRKADKAAARVMAIPLSEFE